MTTLMEVQEPVINEQPSAASPTKVPTPPIAGPALFADVLLEVDSTEKRRRRWSAVSSVIFQCLLMGVVLIIPLMFTDALPKAQLLTFLVAPPPPPPPPPPAAAPAAQAIRRVESDLMDGRLRTPGRIPQRIQMIREEEVPPQISSGGVIGGVEGGIPGGQMGGVLGGIISSTANLALTPKLAPVIPRRVRVSQGVVTGMLINKIEPAYPTLARTARISGEVVLSAIISKEGLIENLQVVSGHPLLIQAAVDAVQQWRYRPFLVSGEPVEVETKITVTFKLSQ